MNHKLKKLIIAAFLAASFDANAGGLFVNSSGNLTVGSTVVGSGTTTRILYDNAGVLGEYVISGSGNVCMSTSCVMTTPQLGTPTSGVLTNATGYTIANLSGAGTGVLTALQVNTGSAGAPVLFNNAGGTPSSITLTNASGTAASLTAGTVTTNANLTGDVTSSGNATTVVKLNGTTLSALGTGLLKNTTGTGVPSIAVNTDLPVMSATVGGAVPTPPNNTTTFLRGDGTFAAPAGGGSSTWTSVTAATADSTTANSTWQIIYNTAPTADSKNAWTFGETSAATGGTITSGIPNQNLLRISTLAASTQSPLRIDSRGGHVFSVGSTTRQILATAGTAANPAYAFAGALGTGVSTVGITKGGTPFAISVGGVTVADFDGAGIGLPFVGTAASPVIIGCASADCGFFFPSSANMAFAVANKEIFRWGVGVIQPSYAAADAVGYALNFRKSRGTVASPTVITTGDDLATISGQAYVGATNTYRNASTIRLDSTGTISDATTGVGGEIVLATMKQGVDTTAVDRFKIDQHGHPVAIAGTANTPTMGTCGASPTITGTDDTMVVTVVAAAVSSCAVNFGTTWVATTVVCVVNSDTDALAMTTSATTAALTMTKTTAFTAGSKLNIMCRGIL